MIVSLVLALALIHDTISAVVVIFIPLARAYSVGKCFDVAEGIRGSATVSIVYFSGWSISFMSHVCIHSAYLHLRQMTPASPEKLIVFLLALLLVLPGNEN